MPRTYSKNPTQFRWHFVFIGGALCYGASVAILAIAGPGPVVEWINELPTLPAIAMRSIPMFLLGACIAGMITGRALRRHARQLMDVVDNVSQALCVVDSGRRLAFYNQRYVELCNLPPERLWPGRPLRDLLEERRTVGAFTGDSDKYIADCARRVAEGKTTEVIVERGGKVFSVQERPMPDDGWVATHEDITERRKAEHQRAAMVEQEQRRSIIDDAILAFRSQVERVLKTVTDNAGTMRATATALFTASRQTSERVEGAVQTSNEASVNVESAAYAADKLSSSIAEINRQLSQTNDVVRNAAKEAQATNNEIGGLAAAAQKIGDVVKMIQDIARQTNLLALNATIEAARAGEAGRGFAVVASEVKSLAVQTAKATEEIAGQIAAVQNSSTEVVQAIRLLAERMQEINHYSSAVAASLHQQNAATGEISQNVASAAKGTKALVSTLGEVAGAASETRRSAQTVLAASEAVETAADSLRTEVHSFLTKVAV
jgi:methyl-accepting chemotaxis protein